MAEADFFSPRRPVADRGSCPGQAGQPAYRRPALVLPPLSSSPTPILVASANDCISPWSLPSCGLPETWFERWDVGTKVYQVCVMPCSYNDQANRGCRTAKARSGPPINPRRSRHYSHHSISNRPSPSISWLFTTTPKPPIRLFYTITRRHATRPGRQTFILSSDSKGRHHELPPSANRPCTASSHPTSSTTNAKGWACPVCQGNRKLLRHCTPSRRTGRKLEQVRKSGEAASSIPDNKSGHCPVCAHVN